MLRIALAGLVLQKIISLEEAEWIDDDLGIKSVPETVQGVIEEIELARERYAVKK